MVAFLGSVGARPGTGIHEWTDVRVVIENNAIVDYTTQFGKAFPDVGTSVSITGGYSVRLSQLAYEHFPENKVGAGALEIEHGATFDQSAAGFTMSGRLLNGGSTTLNATTIVTGSIENNLSLTVRSYLMLQGIAASTGNGFTLSSQTGAPADLYLRGGFVTGYTANPANGNAAIVDFSNNSRISGYGTIGSDFGNAAYPGNGGYLVVRNTTLGTIDADASGQTLLINTQTSATNPIRNDGLLEASNGGTLKVAGSYYGAGSAKSYLKQGSTGIILANAGSTVVLEGTQLTGGKIDSIGTGIVRMSGSDSTLSGVEITARATLDIGRATIFSGTIVNRGLVTNSEFDPVIKIASGGVTLTGGGTVRLVDGYYEAAIIGLAPGAVLTNINNKIIGVGAIGPDYQVGGSTLTVINKGLIAADNDTVYDPNDVDSLVIDGLARLANTGTLEARNGAKLEIRGLVTPLENTGGTVQAVGAGSKVVVSTQVDGGALKGVSGGVIDVQGATLNGLTDAVTLSGTAVFSNTTLQGQIVNKGILANASSGPLKITAADATLSGGGTVQLFGGYYNSGIVGTAAGAVLTNVDNIVIGVGTLSGGELSIVNQNLIAADRDGYKTDDVDALTIDGLARLTNTGTLEARNGAKLEIRNLAAPLTNKGGTVQAVGAGSKVVVSTQVDGGMLKGVSGGMVDVQGATLNGLVDAVTLSGPAVFGNTVLKGNILNFGTLTNAGSAPLKITAQDASLTCGGTIRLLGGYYNSGIVGTAAGSVLTNFDNTIVGVGAIGGSELSIVNQGRIGADKDGYRTDDVDTLTIDGLAALTNKGVLQATNGATLVLRNIGTGTIQNAGGTIQATGAGSKVEIATGVAGGTISAGAGASLQLSTGIVLDGVANQVTISGAVAGADRQTIALKGAIANKSDIELYDATLAIRASTTLSGGGAIEFTQGFYHSANLTASSAGLKLTNVDNTLHGAGSFGALSGLLFANGAAGRVVADHANETLVVETGRTVSNAGIMVAAGGILDIRDKVTGTGHLEVTGGGRLIVDQGVDQDVIFVGATADTLHLSGRTPAQGGKGFDFDIAGMGVGDRIKLDIGASAGQTADFTFTDTAGGATLTSAILAGSDGKPLVVSLTGTYSEGQFSLVGGSDGSFGYVRVATHDGTAASETLTAAAGGERLIGLAGNDVLISGKGNDVLDGGLGIDTVSYVAAKGGVKVGLETKAEQTVGGAMGKDSLISIENLTGSTYSDTLTGNGLANVLKGGTGADILVGGKGADDLFAGADQQTDTFVFLAGDSGVSAATMDQIFDFRADFDPIVGKRSVGADRIDLRGIDADLDLAGDQKLRFVDAFSTAGTSQPDGQVTVVSSGSGSTRIAKVMIDLNGDNKVDMAFEVMNVAKLTVDDFLL